MSTTSIPATWLAAFQPALETRLAGAGMGTVNVYLIPPNRDLPLSESIVLWNGEINSTSNYATFPLRNRDETCVISGVIYTAAADPTESVAMQTAASRGEAILDQIIAQTRDAPPVAGVQILSALVSSHRWRANITDGGEWLLELRYDTSIRARVT